MNLAETRHTSCPQCGAPLAVPRDSITFTCQWCGATLQANEGVPLHFLVEPTRLTSEAARQHVKAWLSGPSFAADVGVRATFEVGAPASALFLRARRRGEDTVRPLGPFQLPEAIELHRVPCDLEPLPQDADVASLVDPQALKEAIAAELLQPGVHDLAVEFRTYYPVQYSYGGDRYTAVLPAAGGQVLALRLPVKRDVLGMRGVVAGVVAVLFGEAVLVPGLVSKLVVVAVTGTALYPALNWLVRRHG